MSGLEANTVEKMCACGAVLRVRVPLKGVSSFVGCNGCFRVYDVLRIASDEVKLRERKAKT